MHDFSCKNCGALVQPRRLPETLTDALDGWRGFVHLVRETPCRCGRIYAVTYRLQFGSKDNSCKKRENSL